MYAYCLCITNIVTVMIEERKRVQGLTCWAPVIALNRARPFNSFPYMLEWTAFIFISVHFVLMRLRVMEIRPKETQFGCYCAVNSRTEWEHRALKVLVKKQSNHQTWSLKYLRLNNGSQRKSNRKLAKTRS